MKWEKQGHKNSRHLIEEEVEDTNGNQKIEATYKEFKNFVSIVLADWTCHESAYNDHLNLLVMNLF